MKTRQVQPKFDLCTILEIVGVDCGLQEVLEDL